MKIYIMNNLKNNISVNLLKQIISRHNEIVKISKILKIIIAKKIYDNCSEQPVYKN